MVGTITAVARKATHKITKHLELTIRLVEGIGVEGDAHAAAMVMPRGKTVLEPNLRQVHLMHGELHDELATKGFSISPGLMGENITTRGLDLLSLPRGTELHLGATAVVVVTGLRTPCHQLDGIAPGLMQATLEKRNGQLLRKAGVMSIVKVGGDVQAGDRVRVVLPEGEHLPLEPV
jgi:MOSC domain-containing protein YiiM